MIAPWLLLDVSYLCWRAYHSTGGLSHNGVPTGVLYGFLRELRNLESRFGSDQFAFFFDLDKPRSLRRELFPGYKNRLEHNHLPLVVEQHGMVRQQIAQLYRNILPDLGYVNVFGQEGYEADDLIASAVHRTYNQVVIVSADNDLLQLLQPGVVIYHPKTKELVNEESFREKWDMPPGAWKQVKAIAGCKSDTIPGCLGVAEYKAAKWLTRQMSKKTVAYPAILAWIETAQYHLNLRLVSLPYPGTMSIHLDHQPPVTDNDWNELMEKMGMKTLKRTK